jgi:glycosyltransferase involved in cell wall biosynthesis
MSTKQNDMEGKLVSIVITCFNQATFLSEAIESAVNQSYSLKEVIVVDDGSTDNTQQIALSYPEVKYIYQQNAGLSAARNAGVENSRGEFLLFLDADDWLHRNAVNINVQFLENDPQLAFVSGWHEKVDQWNYPIANDQPAVVPSDHYLHLLKGNYIGMHAAVLYRSWVFTRFSFDVNLRACEDYDLYLKIARHHPVACHQQKIAAYRIHGNNMSTRIPFMLDHVLKVCDRQQTHVVNEEERNALEEGKKIWRDYYCDKLYNTLMAPGRKAPDASADELLLLLKNKPLGLTRYMRRKMYVEVAKRLKSNLPDRVLRLLHQAGYYPHYVPKPGKVDVGDFYRKTPFSNDFGFDRGGAIDRYYIEKFLDENKARIKGSVLEIGDNAYTLQFGAAQVTESHILHVDATNEKATYVGDIANAPQIPSQKFDCVILTQTLHLIYDFKSAIQTCYRILKPGGTLLITVPGISHIDRGLWRDYWLWSFTDKSIRKVLGEFFPGDVTEVATYGNVFVASAFLYGMGLPEFNKSYLDHCDPSYQVIIAAKVTRI